MPKEIWQRAKQGFVFPFEEWMKEIKITNDINNKAETLRNGLGTGKIHWSRYWSYLLSQQNKKTNTLLTS